MRTIERMSWRGFVVFVAAFALGCGGSDFSGGAEAGGAAAGAGSLPAALAATGGLGGAGGNATGGDITASGSGGVAMATGGAATGGAIGMGGETGSGGAAPGGSPGSGGALAMGGSATAGKPIKMFTGPDGTQWVCALTRWDIGARCECHEATQEFVAATCNRADADYDCSYDHCPNLGVQCCVNPTGIDCVCVNNGTTECGADARAACP